MICGIHTAHGYRYENKGVFPLNVGYNEISHQLDNIRFRILDETFGNQDREVRKQ